jgi:hypothetical protein
MDYIVNADCPFGDGISYKKIIETLTIYYTDRKEK